MFRKKHYHLPVVLVVAFFLSVVAGAKKRVSCSNESSSNETQISLLVSLPYVPAARAAVGLGSHEHIREALLALGENARTKQIAEIVVVLDTLDGQPLGRRLKRPRADEHASATRALRSNVNAEQCRSKHKINDLSSAADLLKVRAHVYGRQPTYSELFRFASSYLRDRLVAVANSDVVLRHLYLLDEEAFRGGPKPLALVLSVSKPSGNFARQCDSTHARHFIKDRCVASSYWRNPGGSWDVEIFWSPLVNAQYEWLEDILPAPVYMNMNGAENRAGLFLARSGYDLWNPCTVVRAQHWHCTEQTHHALVAASATTTAVTLEDSVNFRHNGTRLPGTFVRVEPLSRGVRCPWASEVSALMAANNNNAPRRRAPADLCGDGPRAESEQRKHRR